MFEHVRPNAAGRSSAYHMAMSRTWYTSILWYMGIQSLEARDVIENVDPGLLVQDTGYVANHILRYVSMNVARLTQPKIDWSVTPKTPDQVDRDGAKYAQHLLDHLYDHLDLASKRVEWGLWLKTTGTAFVYANWDSEKGALMRAYFDPFTQQPVQAGQLTPEQKRWLEANKLSRDVKEGDFECEVLSPFQVILPVWCKTLDKMPWCLIRRIMSEEEVWDRWPDVAPDIGPEEATTELAGHFWGKLPTLALRPGLVRPGSTDSDGSIVVDELWIPPSKRMPEGLTAFASEKHLLEHGPHRFAKDGLDLRFPVVDYFNTKIPGRYHGMGDVEHLIGPQRDYNRGRSQVSQHRDVLGIPQWKAPEGCVRRGMLRNELGDVLEYDRTKGTPELVQPPALGEAVNTSVVQSQNDMQIIANASDASMGQMPQGARSGNAVAMLQEKDQMAMGPTVQLQERSCEKLGTHLLTLGHKYMTVPRAITIYGQTFQADVKWFKGTSMNGNTKVRVKAGSMTPRSKAEVFERITQLIGLGVFNVMDPKQVKLILRMLEIGQVETLFTVEDLSRRRAQIENTMFSRPDMAMGQAMPDVNVFDDHQAHYEEHTAFLQTDEFEMLPPLRKKFFEAHIQKHTMAVADAMAAAATVQQAMGGGGGGSEPRQPGKASQPAEKKPTPGQTTNAA